MKTFIICFLMTLNVSAADEAVRPVGTTVVKKFLAEAKNPIPNVVLGKENQDGSAMFFEDHNAFELYEVNVDNEGETEFVLTTIMSGTFTYSGIRSIWKKEKEGLRNIEFDKIVSKTFFKNDFGDIKDFHQNTAKPFIVKRDGKVILRYQDQKLKNKIIEYMLTGKVLKKL